MTTSDAINLLKNQKKQLTPQQFRTIKGQILSGNIDGAMKGLQRITKKGIDYSEKQSHHVS